VTLALWLIAGAAGYATVLLGVLLLGVGGGALNGATNTLVADLHADPQQKSSALNLLGVFFGFGALFLPFTIGVLLQALGLVRILHLTAGLSLVPAVLALALAFPPVKSGPGLRLAEAGRLARHPLVLTLGLLLFFQSASEAIISGYTSTYLTREVGASVSTASYLLAAYWAAIMLGRVVASRLLLRVTGHRLVLASAVGSAAGAALLLSASGAGPAAVALALLGLSFASIYPTTLGLAGSRFAAHSGTVFGILFAIGLIGGMTLSWVVGQVAALYGLRSGLALVVVNALAIFLLRLLIPRFDPQA
jgi:fucose permease